MFSEDYAGSPAFTVEVDATPTALFAGTPPERDTLWIYNGSAGTVAYFSPTADGARLFPILAGECRQVGIRQGQVYSFAQATTSAGTELDAATLTVWAVRVDSAFAREMSTTLASLAQHVATDIPCACGVGVFVLEVEAIRGTDLLGLYGKPVNIRQFDVTGRTLAARFTQPAGENLVIRPLLVTGEQIVRVEFENIPRGPVKFSVVAVLDSDDGDVLGLFSGTVKGT